VKCCVSFHDELRTLTNLISLDLSECSWYSTREVSFAAWPALRSFTFNRCNLFQSEPPFVPDTPSFHVSVQTNYLAAGMEHAEVHVRSAGSFRSECTLAEVLAPTLSTSIVSLHLDLCRQCEASFYLDTMSQLLELCLRLESLHLNGCDKEPDQHDFVCCKGAAGQLRHLKLSGVCCIKLDFSA